MNKIVLVIVGVALLVVVAGFVYFLPSSQDVSESDTIPVDNGSVDDSSNSTPTTLSCSSDADCTGFNCCNSECVDLDSNYYNCGSCGSQCSGSELCVAGACAQCGNASCEPEEGEDCNSCVEDCACSSGSCTETSPGSGEYECS